MGDATQDAKKSSSFDLVEKEIAHTVEQAELSLIRFQENREGSEDLQNCIDCLNQLRGIFTLIELQGGTVLCQETIAVANEVPVGASDDKNELLSAISQAIFVIHRYIDYFDRRREDHPELLLGVINTLRTAREAKPLQDSYFFEVDLARQAPAGLSESVEPKIFAYRTRRMRHMFQIGLLTLLKKREKDIGLRLLSRACLGFQKLCGTASLARLWELSHLAAEVMHEKHMLISPARQRLFMRIERYARELAKVGSVAAAKHAADTILRDLIYILSLSGSGNPSVTDLLQSLNVETDNFDEQKLVAHRHYLMGPGSDVLSSLSKALHEELDQLKDKLDMIERGIEGSDEHYADILAGLRRLGDTLWMVDLRQLSDLSKSVAKDLNSWLEDGSRPSHDELMKLADAVLNIEQAVKHLEDEGLTSETDRMASLSEEKKSSPFLNEAHVVVVGESKSAISLAKRAITAYLESGGDKLHLANIQQNLAEIEGALIIVSQIKAAKTLNAIERCIKDKLLDADDRPAEHVLETLADALTSLEYFVESLSRSESGNGDLLKLAEDSVKALGY